MLNHFLRMDLLAEVLLPVNHPFRIHLVEHNEQLRHFVLGIWRSTVLCRPGATAIRAALYLQKQVLEFSIYWRKKRQG